MYVHCECDPCVRITPFRLDGPRAMGGQAGRASNSGSRSSLSQEEGRDAGEWSRLWLQGPSLRYSLGLNSLEVNVASFFGERLSQAVLALRAQQTAIHRAPASWSRLPLVFRVYSPTFRQIVIILFPSITYFF